MIRTMCRRCGYVLKTEEQHNDHEYKEDWVRGPCHRCVDDELLFETNPEEMLLRAISGQR